ncbi:MAG: LamG domain-containing protein [Proteobacteria bacterium]|nr:LamG domain-containing protein [Pseudomonadota bacterium]
MQGEGHVGHVGHLGWLLVGCAACSFTGQGVPTDPGDGGPTSDVPLDANPSPWLPGFAHRKAIRVAGVALTDFPLAIVEAGDPELAAATRGDGGDLVITDGDGQTILASELVSFDGATGALELWTRIPMLAPTTRAYLYYGGPATPRTPTAVWPARFAGVWHLANGQARDSTTAALDLTEPAPGASPAIDLADGLSHEVRAYDGVDDSLRIADTASASLDFATASFAYAIWVKVTSSVGEYDAPIWNGGTSSGEHGYTMLLGHNDWGAKVHDGTTYVDASFGAEATLAGRWVHLVAVVDRSANRLRTYADGAMVTSADITAIGNLDNAIAFGLGVPGGTAPFRGLLDEVRVYADPPSDAWIAAEHQNLADPSFVTISSEESP